MTNRITNAMIERRAEYLNDLLGVAQAMYQTRDVVDGKPVGDLVANAGHCYLAGAYGGFKIEQMCAGGGSRDLLSMGFDTKRNVYDRLNAYIDGLQAGKEKFGEPDRLTTYRVEASVRKQGAIGEFVYTWFWVPAPNMHDRAYMIKGINGQGYELSRIRTVQQTDQGL